MSAKPSTSPAPDDAVRQLLAWLSEPHDISKTSNRSETALQYISLFARTPMQPRSRQKLLDLIEIRSTALIDTLCKRLVESSPPLGKPLKRETRNIQTCLQLLHDTCLIDSTSIAMQCRAARFLARHIEISFLSAAPVEAGIWQKFNTIFSNSRAQTIVTEAGTALHQDYLACQLIAISQPAGFTGHELTIGLQHARHLSGRITITNTPSPNSRSVFWIDPLSDSPAQAMCRRSPPERRELLFFSCDSLSILSNPDNVTTSNDSKLLFRFQDRWCNPAKRKFPRRRRSQRLQLVHGWPVLLDRLKTKNPATPSEWMVINESPDGYALMHIHGPKDAISVNNLVAIELPSGNNLPAPNPAIAIIRWVLSENPEHLEIGLQVLATQGFAVNVVLTGETPARTAQGIWLKRQPPLLTKDLLALPSDHQIQHQARCTLSNAEIGSEPQDWQIAGTREDNGVTSLYTLSPVGTG